MSRPPVLVVGAGVSGLTCAVSLADAGFDVTVRARELPLETTSAVAAAVWYPPRAARDGRMDEWLRISFARFSSLAGDDDAGVVLRHGIEVFRAPASDAWWRGALPGFRHAEPDELPAGCVDGFVAHGVPVIDMGRYLPWLAREAEARGVRIEHVPVTSLDEAPIVVNCSGLGARELCSDTVMVPVRGQVVRVAPCGIDRYLLDESNPDGMVYIYPRIGDVVLGGTRQEGDERTEPDPHTAEEILARCTALEPRLQGARILSHGVGIRPGRASVRLEVETRPSGTLVVHNYGHASNGVTLSWGCAADVTLALEEATADWHPRR